MALGRLAVWREEGGWAEASRGAAARRGVAGETKAVERGEAARVAAERAVAVVAAMESETPEVAAQWVGSAGVQVATVAVKTADPGAGEGKGEVKVAAKAEAAREVAEAAE